MREPAVPPEIVPPGLERVEMLQGPFDGVRVPFPRLESLPLMTILTRPGVRPYRYDWDRFSADGLVAYYRCVGPAYPEEIPS